MNSAKRRRRPWKQPGNGRRSGPSPVWAVAANAAGEIMDLEGLSAVGMSGDRLIPLTTANTIHTPFGSELMMLPDRHPIVYDRDADAFVELTQNPYDGGPVFAVGAFNSPGHVVTWHPGYVDPADADYLPLFSYGAVGWQDGSFRSAAVVVDREPRQDLRQMPEDVIRDNAIASRETMKENRLRDHIEHCALVYGCPAAKNFFLARYEAPLPTSRHCNARCLGCISLQQEGRVHHCQDRIRFTPTASEISEIALTHIRRVKNSVVSFGQGCEGDPLFAVEAIAPALETVRRKQNNGTINMNTNASLPHVVADLFDRGLDSIRVSLNSVRQPLYEAYYRPRGYTFADVKKSIRIAGEKGKFVSINYLNCPGVTDTPEEREALIDFLKNHPVDFIQWRNLNFDPIRYRKRMAEAGDFSASFGTGQLVQAVRKQVPRVGHGYFNPPRERFSGIRNLKKKG